MYPGDPNGPAAEVVNCRCALLERAKWALGNSFSEMDNESKEMVNFKDVNDYNEFKKEYTNTVKKEQKSIAKQITIYDFADAINNIADVILELNENCIGGKTVQEMD